MNVIQVVLQKSVNLDDRQNIPRQVTIFIFKWVKILQV